MPQEILTAEQVKVLARESWTEEEFQQAVIDLAMSYGWKPASFRKVRVQRKNGSTFWETPVGAQGKGWPDCFFARAQRGHVFGAELKVKKNKLTPEQEDWKRILSAAGIPVFEWRPRDWEEIEMVLRGGPWGTDDDQTR